MIQKYTLTNTADLMELNWDLIVRECFNASKYFIYFSQNVDFDFGICFIWTVIQELMLRLYTSRI